MKKSKLIRITTVPISLEKLLTGQLTYMNQFYEVIAISSEKTKLKKFGEKNMVKTFHINLTRKITPIQDFLAILKLVLFLVRHKPFVVHTHTPKAGMVGMIASKIAGVPNRLHTVAGLPLMETSGLKRRILNMVEMLTYSCATKVYPNSNGLKEIILENKFTSGDKLKVIGNGSSNGIDTSYFSPAHFSPINNEKLKNKLKINLDDFVFIFVGRLVRDKGIEELIDAFKKLEQPRVKLLLVGSQEPDLDPLSREIIKEIEVNINIVSVGYQEDVRPYFAISNALVFPSYREGFPNVVMQAGAMGLPSIVTNINGCNEIIKPNINGIIIPVKNREAILEAMRDLLENNILFDRLTQNAREAIVSKYEQKVIWEAIYSEYLSLEHV